MIVDLREHGKTINQPFCFAPGAVAIKQQLVKMFSCHDVEVGIYVQRIERKMKMMLLTISRNGTGTKT